MSDLLDLYQTLILEHSRHPHHQGRLVGEDVHAAEGDNPLCGDRVTVYLRTAGDRIVDAGFEGDGCAISIASASMLCDAVIGCSLDEASALFTRVHGMVMGTGDAGVEADRAGGDDGDDGDGLDAYAASDLGPVAALSGVRRFPMRVKCATLAWHTMRDALPASPPSSASGSAPACDERPITP